MSDNEPYYHLVPADVWLQQQDGDAYVPEAYESDGFIHLTIGADNLIDVANRFYRSDARDYLALELDQTRITSPVRFDDDSGLYPHVYGPLDAGAVRSVRTVVRQPDGTFVEIV